MSTPTYTKNNLSLCDALTFHTTNISLIGILFLFQLFIFLNSDVHFLFRLMEILAFFHVTSYFINRL